MHFFLSVPEDSQVERNAATDALRGFGAAHTMTGQMASSAPVSPGMRQLIGASAGMILVGAAGATPSWARAEIALAHREGLPVFVLAHRDFVIPMGETPVLVLQYVEPAHVFGMVELVLRDVLGLAPLPPFDPSATAKSSLLVESVSDDLLMRLRDQPSLIHEIPGRKFEELVAELLRLQGYRVTLTQRSRDGGKDMFAHKDDGVVKSLFLVECKRYAPQKLVGVKLVREFWGVIEADRATGGVLVTTSGFTLDAQRFQGTVEHRLTLRDYTAIQQWLQLGTARPVPVQQQR